MRTFDFTPFRRSTVGFDRLFEALENSARAEAVDNYPPFNIEKRGDDAYRVTVAVAGFAQDEIEITAQQNLLIVAGRKAEETGERVFLHRGIGTRAFERRFELADFVQVRNAALEHGLLVIDLVREVPEALKPRKIEIGAATPVQIEASADVRKAA